MSGEFGDLPDLAWSPWVPLEGARSHAAVPRLPGLYRIRSVQTGRILSIGQTGRTLKERMGALKGVYGEVMPYNDPHTAGPALWAHGIEFGETFEVSVAVLDVDRADRMGREALEVTKQRIINYCSPHLPLRHNMRGLLRTSRPRTAHSADYRLRSFNCQKSRPTHLKTKRGRGNDARQRRPRCAQPLRP